MYTCEECGDLLDVVHNFESIKEKNLARLFDSRLGSSNPPYNSGVWRYKELIDPDISKRDIVSIPEGNTNVYTHRKLSEYVGIRRLLIKHEGENPTGSFKDRGMTVGVSKAKSMRIKTVACASTGNTSASLAYYAAREGMKCVVLIPEGKIAYGKLSQALAYGATVIQIKGNFDDAMSLVQELDTYLLNSVNPWRIEGQKSITFELLQQFNHDKKGSTWDVPDWKLWPAGNLGNTAACGKALDELYEIELIDQKPSIVSIQAEGANPLYQTWKSRSDELIRVENPETIATAIKIGNPVNWKKAIRSLKSTHGGVEQVSDQEIMEAKAIVDRCGIGCEPASAASIAGAKKLTDYGIIDKNETVVCILTGNILKDPDGTVKYHMNELPGIIPEYANKPIVIEPNLEDVKKALGKI